MSDKNYRPAVGDVWAHTDGLGLDYLYITVAKPSVKYPHSLHDCKSIKALPEAAIYHSEDKDNFVFVRRATAEECRLAGIPFTDEPVTGSTVPAKRSWVDCLRPRR